MNFLVNPRHVEIYIFYVYKLCVGTNNIFPMPRDLEEGGFCQNIVCNQFLQKPPSFKL